MVCKSPYKYKSLLLISNFFQLETQLYCEKGCRKQKVFEVEGNKNWK